MNKELTREQELKAELQELSTKREQDCLVELNLVLGKYNCELLPTSAIIIDGNPIGVKLQAKPI